ncbi:heme peroxidase, partial [Cynara cardunculus var. scolymus]
GCDGSILISSKPGSKELAEKDAQDNKEIPVEAYDIIEKAKAMVESKCPGVVSCADILALAARDFIHLLGGPYYPVKKGRWDGQTSMASLVYSNIPHANSTIDDMLKLFSSKGLTLNDLVVLSGAHSIGFAHCKNFVNRLYNFEGTNKPDPDMDPRLLKSLRRSCPQYGGNVGVVTPFDATTPFAFDNAYYQNLQRKLGLLASDKALFLDPRTRPLVQALAKDKNKFFQEFSLVMDKLGNVGVKRGKKHGEIRR